LSKQITPTNKNYTRGLSCVDWCKSAEVNEEATVSIFKIDPEDRGGKQLRNVCTYLPDYTASHTFTVTDERTSNLTPTTAPYNGKVIPVFN